MSSFSRQWHAHAQRIEEPKANMKNKFKALALPKYTRNCGHPKKDHQWNRHLYEDASHHRDQTVDTITNGKKDVCPNLKLIVRCRRQRSTKTRTRRTRQRSRPREVWRTTAKRCDPLSQRDSSRNKFEHGTYERGTRTHNQGVL